MTGYRDIPAPGPAYRAAADAALADGTCPDCGRPILRVNGELEDGAAVELLECGTCDTSWTLRDGAPPAEFRWQRWQRTASILHAGTGRHPLLAVFHEALVAAGLDPATLPTLVSAPLNRFPHTEDEADRFDRFGALMFMPPTGTNHPTRVPPPMGPALKAAFAARESPYE